MLILFILFTTPLFKIFQENNKKTELKIRGYIDNRLFTAKTTDETKSILLIQEVFRKIKLWAYQNGIIFNAEKFEVIHFFQKKRFQNPNTLLLDNSLSSASGK